MRAVLLALLLSGCAAQPYWVRDAAPVTPTRTVEVGAEKIAAVCNRDAPGSSLCANPYGYFDRATGVTYVLKGLSSAVRACVVSHESGPGKSHARGYDHPLGRMNFIDCGDGTWLSYDYLVGAQQ